MSAGGGGAWKVAYADFVTAMMAFFMVMWLTTQKAGVKEAVAGYFRDPFATFKSTEKGAAATAAITNPMYGHTSQPQKRKLKISGDSTDYQFTVVFPNDDATIEPSQLDYIKNFAPMMVGKLNRVEVRGHCLRRPLPEGTPFADHWQLCFARCQAVKKQLEEFGIEPERIRLSQAEGNEPLSLNLSEDELQLNSRVDVILLPDLAEIAWQRPQPQKEEEQEQPVESSHGEGVNAGMSETHEPPASKEKHGAKEDRTAEAAEKHEGTEKAEGGEKAEHTSEHEPEHSEEQKPAHSGEAAAGEHSGESHATEISVSQAQAAAEAVREAPVH